MLLHVGVISLAAWMLVPFIYLMHVAMTLFPVSCAEHAQFLESKYGTQRFGGIVFKAFESARVSQSGARACDRVFKDIGEDSTLDREQFQEVRRDTNLASA